MLNLMRRRIPTNGGFCNCLYDYLRNSVKKEHLFYITFHLYFALILYDMLILSKSFLRFCLFQKVESS